MLSSEPTKDLIPEMIFGYFRNHFCENLCREFHSVSFGTTNEPWPLLSVHYAATVLIFTGADICNKTACTCMEAWSHGVFILRPIVYPTLKILVSVSIQAQWTLSISSGNHQCISWEFGRGDWRYHPDEVKLRGGLSSLMKDGNNGNWECLSGMTRFVHTLFVQFKS